MNQVQPSLTPALSVILPTLNEAAALGGTLDSLARMHGSIEVIVADGGSADETVAIARQRGVQVILTARGRGSQMHAAACAAQGEILWFLHADTHPPVHGGERVVQALRDAGVVGGNFAVRFEGTRYAARFLTFLYPYLRWLGLCYGDSAIFVRRSAYIQSGGFQPLPIFEDLDLLRRLRRLGRLVHLPDVVVTSSRRFERRGFTLTFARWSVLQVLYWIGVPPRLLGRWYAPIRR